MRSFLHYFRPVHVQVDTNEDLLAHAFRVYRLIAERINLVPRAHVPFGQHQDKELSRVKDFRSSGFTAHACHGLHGIQK